MQSNLICALLTWALALITLQIQSAKANIIYVGRTSDGKSYFYETESMNWTSAQTSCEQFGLGLASVDSVVQEDFLRTYLPQGDKDWYWSAGRETRKLAGVVWDNSDAEPDLTGYKMEFHHFSPEVQPYHFCFLIHSFGSLMHLSAALCSSAFPALCQHSI